MSRPATDTKGMLAFFEGVSQFYSGFDLLLRQRVAEAYPDPQTGGSVVAE
jgi:hypothetical protein